MDILTSMLAYLGCVTGLIGALAISFFVYFSASASSANLPPSAAHATAALSASAMTARQTAPKVIAGAEAKSSSDTPSTDKPAIAKPATVAEHPLHVAAIAPAPVPRAPASRQSPLPSRADYFRRLVQQERAKRWAYQQDPDFESRFLGYAD